MTTIVAAATRHLALPTGIKPFVLPSGLEASTDLNVLLVRLTDSEGIEGHAYLWGAEQRQIPLFRATLEYLAGQVVGTPVGDPTQLRATLRRSTNFVGYDGLASFGVAAFEMAAHDLVLLRSGSSLGETIGRRRDRVRAYRTGCLLPFTVDEIVAEANDIVESGVHAIKVQIGKPDIAEDLDRIAAVRDSVAGHVVLMVDAVQRYELSEALRVCDGLAELGVVRFEDALDYDDLAGYAELAARSPIPIATGESLYGLASFARLLDAGIAHVVADLERVGGIAGWLAVADLVAGRGGTILPHLDPHLSAQLMSTVDTPDPWLEVVPWFDALAAPLRIVDGWVAVPDQAGTGFRPDPNAVDDLAVGSWQPL